MLKAKYYDNEDLVRTLLKTAIEQHRKMWSWIADKTEEQRRVVRKSEFFEAHPEEPRPVYDCYACDFVYEISLRDRSGLKCRYCPFDWGSNSRTVRVNCESWHSPYKHWDAQRMVNGDWKEAAKYARMIAEIPLKEVVK